MDQRTRDGHFVRAYPKAATWFITYNVHRCLLQKIFSPEMKLLGLNEETAHSLEVAEAAMIHTSAKGMLEAGPRLNSFC